MYVNPSVFAFLQQKKNSLAKKEWLVLPKTPMAGL